ncbi:PKD domain-containing protein [Chloroflexota bacterium]
MVIALPLISHTIVKAQEPFLPGNISPAYEATGISPTHPLRSSDFVDPDSGALSGGSHYASQWQVTNISGNYTNPVFDSGIDTANLVEVILPLGILGPNTTYYWHVRHQDDIGYWSNWSLETSFTTVASKSPSTPYNNAPANETFDILLTPLLKSSPFNDPDVEDTHLASRWQIRHESGTYDSPIFDSSVDESNLTEISMSLGYLEYDTTYYWHVRYQDSYGNWSAYSNEISFATVATLVPNQPVHVSPKDSAIDVSRAPTFLSSNFSDPESKDTHTASQWQIRHESETYDSPIFDTSIDESNLTEIRLSSGYLEYGTTYYWHVRYRDSYGNWSAYSLDASFTTIPTKSPLRPQSISTPDDGDSVSLTPTLQSSEFFDLDEGDSHIASQWQITTNPEDYSSPAYDSGIDTANLVEITVPSETLIPDTTYYWHVRYQDSYDNWSSYSFNDLFTTSTSTAITTDVTAKFSVSTALPATGQTITITDTSTGDIISWAWDFGDGTTQEWTKETRPNSSEVSHAYSAEGIYTLSLQVSNLGEVNTKTRAIKASGPISSSGGGLPIYIWIVIPVVIIGGAAAVIVYRRRQV